MKPADGSHPNQNLQERGNESLHTSIAQAGTLVCFSQPIPYAEAWILQKRLQTERIAERQRDILLLLEHTPVYTLGRTTKPTHWNCGSEVLRLIGASLQSVDRGGSITYHGPGQVVGYPILKLSEYCSGPKQYVRKLEEVLIRTLLRWKIAGYRLEKKPGVWVRWNHTDAKIAAIGVRIDHGVTIHGFAINVDLDLSPFSCIMPCGLSHCHITSLAEVKQSPVSPSVVAQQVALEFAQVFNIQWTGNSPTTVEQERHDHRLTSTSPLHT